MKLYKVNWSDESIGSMQRWFPSKAAANKGIKEIKAEYEDDKDWTHMLYVTAVEIPTTKAGLIKWLNESFSTDNG